MISSKLLFSKEPVRRYVLTAESRNVTFFPKYLSSSIAISSRVMALKMSLPSVQALSSAATVDSSFRKFADGD
jgi:hypothetical protein